MQFKDPQKKVIVATLGFVIHDDSVLLGMKKRGFGEGHWNGFGGKPEKGENLEEALIREFQEECEIEIEGPIKQGELYFDLEMEDFNLVGHIYRITSWQGEPKETEEMRPQWFKLHEIPYDFMWIDDQHWLPHFLEQKDLQGYFHFKDRNTLLHHEINITDQ